MLVRHGVIVVFFKIPPKSTIYYSQVGWIYSLVGKHGLTISFFLCPAVFGGGSHPHWGRPVGGPLGPLPVGFPLGSRWVPVGPVARQNKSRNMVCQYMWPPFHIASGSKISLFPIRLASDLTGSRFNLPRFVFRALTFNEQVAPSKRAKKRR